MSASKADLCGTAAGFNALGADHRRCCNGCREAARVWFRDMTAARLRGELAAWLAANPPAGVRGGDVL